MAANTYESLLHVGTQAEYDSLATKNTNHLYFCTDTGKMYKGTVDFTNSVEYVSTKPAAPVAGKLYVIADTATVEAWNGSAWTVLALPATTTVDASSDDNHVPTAKAVYDAVKDLVGGGDVVKSIANKAGTDATVTITAGDDTTSDLTINGVVTTPTWDSTTRKLTLPVSGSTAVEVEIGKDMFLDPSGDNRYDAENKKIILTLNDGDGAEHPATKIEIPVDDLVDTYTGTTDDGTSVTVDGTTNTIKASIVIDPDTKNVLKKSATGLMVDGSIYALASDVETLEDTVADNTGSITNLAAAALGWAPIVKAAP